MPPRPLTKTPRELVITVSGIPVSVNHYVKRARSGHRYVTAEALKFKQDVCQMAGTTTPLVAKKYSVELLFFFGKGQKSDIDNLGKLPLDALVEAGLIHSDAAIMELLMCKYRDEANPRTVIKVTAW